AGTVDVFRQARTPDALAVLETLNMDTGLVDTLGELPVGTCVHWQSGRRPRPDQLRHRHARRRAPGGPMTAPVTSHQEYCQVGRAICNPSIVDYDAWL